MLASAIGDCDLSALLYEWDPNWAESGLSSPTTGLGDAVLQLVDERMIEVGTGGSRSF